MTDDLHEGGHATPEEAARGDIPARYARAISVVVSPDGDQAIVVLGTNEEPYVYPYEVNCSRAGGRWFEMGGSNGVGFGWNPRTTGEDERILGVLRLAGEAPPGVREVVVEWNSREHQAPVTSGYFFFTEWDVPEDFQDTVGRPRAVRYVHEDGTEETVEPDPLLELAWQWMRDTKGPEPPF